MASRQKTTQDSIEHETEEDIDALLELEEQFRTVQSKAGTGSETEDSQSMREFLSMTKDMNTNTVRGRITSIKPHGSKITLVIRADSKIVTDTVSVPKRTTGYSDSHFLVRLLDYVDKENPSISDLRGEIVPVRRNTEDEYNIVLPEQTNRIAKSLFWVWQGLLKYQLVDYDSESENKNTYRVTQRFQSLLLTGLSIVSLASAQGLATIADTSQTAIIEMSFNFLSFVMFMIAGVNLMILSTMLFGVIIITGAIGFEKTMNRIEKYTPF